MKFLAILALTITACAPSMYSQRIGGIFPARPEGCDVVIENTEAAVAMLKYRQVGMISFTGGNAGDIDADLQQRVKDEACKLGGNVVTLNTAMSAGVAANLSQFLVFVRAPAETKTATKDATTL